MNKKGRLFISPFLCACMVAGMTFQIYADDTTKQVTTASEVVTEAQTEVTTTQEEEVTTAESTTHKENSASITSTTKKEETKQKSKKKKTKKIKTTNKVKKLTKDKTLKEEKVDANIIPKIYNDTRLSMKDQKETIGDYIYFNQGDSAWNENGYCIKKAGCGPTSMAVCITSLTGKWVTPIDTTVWAYEHGYYSNAGSVHSLIPALAKEYKLNCDGLGTDYAKIKKALQSNHPVVALMGPGYFTKGGHFMVLVGIDEKDQVTVADVGSRERSTYKYALSDVIEQSKSAQAGGPFWEISNPTTKQKVTKKKKVEKIDYNTLYREKDIKTVLQAGDELAVPLKKGTILKQDGFVTLKKLVSAKKVLVKVNGVEKTYFLADVIKEMNTEAISGTFWEMQHPLEKKYGPTMSDYLQK